MVDSKEVKVSYEGTLVSSSNEFEKIVHPSTLKNGKRVAFLQTRQKQSTIVVYFSILLSCFPSGEMASEYMFGRKKHTCRSIIRRILCLCMENKDEYKHSITLTTPRHTKKISVISGKSSLAAQKNSGKKTKRVLGYGHGNNFKVGRNVASFSDIANLDDLNNYSATSHMSLDDTLSEASIIEPYNIDDKGMDLFENNGNNDEKSNVAYGAKIDNMEKELAFLRSQVTQLLSRSDTDINQHITPPQTPTSEILKENDSVSDKKAFMCNEEALERIYQFVGDK